MYNFGKSGFDPGHYLGANAGPGVYREGNVMLNMGLALQNQYGCFLTRTDEKNLDLKARATKAKAAGCNTLVSIHTNAPEAAKGIIVFYSVQRPGDKAMAEYIGRELSKAAGIAFRKVATRSFESDPLTDYYGIIRNSIRQGIEHVFIVEHGSHWEFAIDTEAKIKACAECYGRVLGLKKKMEAKYYIHNAISMPVVKKGFINIATKRLQAELNSAGFSCGAVDGDFGVKTDKAVKLYQKACGLVQDGIVGAKTWAALLNVHVVELDPGMLKAGLVSSISAYIKADNFINANFFNGSKTLGWLASEGKILCERDNHKKWLGMYDKPKGTFIVYKDGSVEVGMKTDKQMDEARDRIQFCCQGFNLNPLDLKKEGFSIDEVGRACNSVSLGYNDETGKALLVVRQGTNAERAKNTMLELGCKKSIRLDSGDSCNFKVAGKWIFNTDRKLTNIVFW